MSTQHKNDHVGNYAHKEDIVSASDLAGALRYSYLINLDLSVSAVAEYIERLQKSTQQALNVINSFRNDGGLCIDDEDVFTLHQLVSCIGSIIQASAGVSEFKGRIETEVKNYTFIRNV